MTDKTNNDENPEQKDLTLEGESLESIKDMVLQLMAYGVLEEDIYTDRETDPPEVRKLKQELRKRVLQISQKKGKTVKEQQEELIEEVKKDILRFLDFDHNRDRDGKLNSLGETGAHVSAFEAGLAKMAGFALAAKSAQAMGDDFKGPLGEKIAEMKENLMNQLRDEIAKQTIQAAGTALGINPNLIKAGTQLAQSKFEHDQQMKDNQKQNAPKTPEEQQAFNQELLTKAKEAVKDLTSHPDMQQGGPMNYINQGAKGKGEEGMSR